MTLSDLTEEAATFYGKMLDHDYTTKEVFNKNYFKVIEMKGLSVVCQKIFSDNWFLGLAKNHERRRTLKNPRFQQMWLYRNKWVFQENCRGEEKSVFLLIYFYQMYVNVKSLLYQYSSKEEKKIEKEKNELIVQQFGVAIVDGHDEKIGNFRIEPPGKKNSLLFQKEN